MFLLPIVISFTPLIVFLYTKTMRQTTIQYKYHCYRESIKRGRALYYAAINLYSDKVYNNNIMQINYND